MGIICVKHIELVTWVVLSRLVVIFRRMCISAYRRPPWRLQTWGICGASLMSWSTEYRAWTEHQWGQRWYTPQKHGRWEETFWEDFRCLNIIIFVTLVEHSDIRPKVLDYTTQPLGRTLNVNSLWRYFPCTIFSEAVSGWYVSPGGQSMTRQEYDNSNHWNGWCMCSWATWMGPTRFAQAMVSSVEGPFLQSWDDTIPYCTHLLQHSRHSDTNIVFDHGTTRSLLDSDLEHLEYQALSSSNFFETSFVFSPLSAYSIEGHLVDAAPLLC